jgi:hypothetical protein
LFSILPKKKIERYSQTSRTSESISKRFTAKGITDVTVLDAIKNTTTPIFKF